MSLSLPYLCHNLVSDALLGLRELFNSNWEILNSCLTPLVNALVRLIGDEVRDPSLLFERLDQRQVRMLVFASNYCHF